MKNKQAFPRASISDYGDGIGIEGMSLRNYYAAKAMQSFIIVAYSEQNHSAVKPIELVTNAFEYADAMIAFEEQENK